MDTDIQQLERAVERDPSDYEAILRLAQNYERMAWTHRGRSPREWMKDLENPHLRWGVAEALESAGPVFIPALVETLTHERPAVRWRAATMLSRIRPARTVCLTLPHSPARGRLGLCAREGQSSHSHPHR